MSPEDVAKCEDRYNKSKMVHSIMRHVGETTGKDLEVQYSVIKTASSIMLHVILTPPRIDCTLPCTPAQELYKKVAWPLFNPPYGHAFDAFKTMVQDDGDAIFKKLEEVNGGPIDVLSPEVSNGREVRITLPTAHLAAMQVVVYS